MWGERIVTSMNYRCSYCGEVYWDGLELTLQVSEMATHLLITHEVEPERILEALLEALVDSDHIERV